MTDVNYELIIAAAVIALIAKIVWDWLTRGRMNGNGSKQMIDAQHKTLGQIETELRKLNHAVSNLRQAADAIGHNLQEVRDEMKDLRK